MINTLLILLRIKKLRLLKQSYLACLALLLTAFQINAAVTVRYQHTDVLGSVIMETDTTGQIIGSKHQYKPFGEGANGQKSGLGYTGHLEDTDIGLTYMQQRYYDPVIGRFYSNDPVGFTASNPMMFNRYAYANNNPYMYIDPDGRNSYNPQGLTRTMSPAQINLIRKSSTAGFGPALGLKIGVQVPGAKASLGAEASMVVQNGPEGVEQVTTIEAGGKIESNIANAKAQLFKIEEKSDSRNGYPKVTSVIEEGPRLDGEINSGSASVSSQGNKIKVEATVVIVKFFFEVDGDKM